MRWFYSLTAMVILFHMFHFTSSASLPIQISTDFITAHRGSSFTTPENTLTAINQAIQDRAGMVEIDVRMTADGRVVLSHDDSLKRTAGMNVLVSETNYHELLQYNVAYKFRHTYNEERIPTLEEALEAARGHIKVNIELKSDAVQPELAYYVVRIIELFNMEEQCVITSFNYEVLQQVRELTDEIKTGIIIGRAGDFTNELFSDPCIDIVSVRASLINRKIMKQARDHDLLIYAWTVNHQELMKQMIRFQVDSIITDKPAVLHRLLR